MKSKHPLRGLVAVGISSFLAIQAGAASDETVLYNFPANVYPVWGLLPGKPATFYGPTTDGGAENIGTIYELKQTKHGWKKDDIYSFGSNDAHFPNAGLISGATSKVLYGVTSSGPTGDAGAVFSLVRDEGAWKEDILHEFSGADGTLPSAILLRDNKTGTLYGTAEKGGNFDCGTVFQIDSANLFTRIFSFDSNDEGCNPNTPLRQGSSPKKLIGTTSHGGVSNFGTIFSLANARGNWTEKVLQSLDGAGEGAFPSDLTTCDPNGVYYGVAQMYGAYGGGVVFQIGEKTPYKVIYSFMGGSDGFHPLGLYLDADTGVLFGTTLLGGPQNKGTVFKLAYDGTKWTETVLYSFTGGNDGGSPVTRPAIQSGRLYGTTASGGKHGGGVAYEITP